MKKSTYSTVFLVLLGLCTFISSCKDKEEDILDQNKSSFTQSFSAKVNGTAFSPEFVSGILSTQTNTIVITGSMADGEQIQLFVPTNVSRGEYAFSNPLGGTIVQAYYGVNDDDYEFARPVEDKMTVTSHNVTAKQISGTFAFQSDIEGKGVFNITEGSFSVSY